MDHPLRACAKCGTRSDARHTHCPHCHVDFASPEQQQLDLAQEAPHVSAAAAAGADVLARFERGELEQAEHQRAMAVREAKDRLASMEAERFARDLLAGEPLRHMRVLPHDHTWKDQPGEDARTQTLDQNIERTQQELQRLSPSPRAKPRLGYEPDASDAQPSSWLIALAFLLGFIALVQFIRTVGASHAPKPLAIAGAALFVAGVVLRKLGR